MLLNDLDHAISSLIKLSVCPFVVLVVGSAIISLLNQLPAAAELGLFCMLILLSPIAYVIRENRSGHGRDQTSRRGAERTPLLPGGGVE